MSQRWKKILWGIGGTGIALFPALLIGHVEGPDVRHTGAPGDAKFSCADAGQCHTPIANQNTGGPVNSFGGSVSATFSSGPTYTPGGDPITVTVTVTDPAPTWTGHYGFQMTARLDSNQANGQAGHFVAGTNQGVFCDNTDNLANKGVCAAGVVEFIEHSFPSMQSSAQTTPYSFTWTPPATDVGPVHFYVAGNAVNNDHQASGADHVYTNSYTLTAAAKLPAPVLVTGGVLNAASFAKNGAVGAAVAPGSLVAIFGANLGSSVVDASSAPFLTSLGGVTIKFNGTAAPIKDVIPTGAFPFVNAQVPFGVTGSTATVVATVNNVDSGPITIPIVPSAPGIFTYPASGLGNAILVYLDTDKVAKIAAPGGAIPGYTTAPIKRGTSAFFYAAGLGTMNPPVTDGDGGGSVTHFANVIPNIFFGGVMVKPDFAGQAPGFPGVYQINVTVPSSAPTGSAVQIWLTTPDGSVTSNKATVAIQ